MEEKKDIKEKKYEELNTTKIFVVECIDCHFHFFTKNYYSAVCHNCNCRHLQIFELKPIFLINVESLK
jgi:hypothetical protein